MLYDSDQRLKRAFQARWAEAWAARGLRGRKAGSISQPHDKYFQRVFSNERNAASLLSTCVPPPLADTLKWSTLTVLPGRFVQDDWRGSESDLLFSVEREGSGTPVLVYALLEHQSTPDRWLWLRLLGYCVQVWQRWQTQPEEYRRLISEALQRNVPGRARHDRRRHRPPGAPGHHLRTPVASC